MYKFFVLFVFLFSISVFTQSSLLDYGSAGVSGRSIIEVPFSPIVFLDQVTNGVNGYFSDSDCQSCGTLQQSIADNFAVATAGPTYGITGLVFWGGYFPENIPNPIDDFTITVYTDAGGFPGTVVDSRTHIEADSRSTTGIILFGVDEYVFTFDFSASPIMVSTTGSYWIEIFNNSTASSNFFWETGNLDGTHGIAGSAFAFETPGITWNPLGDDMSILISGDDAVPVELASFEATINGENVNLNWSTASETNNQGFSIERSTGAAFGEVGYVAGFGTTTESKYYTFTDRQVSSGNYSYRLKQIDFDGTVTYSKVVEVEILAPAEFNLAQNYPNPFNPATAINFSLAADSKVSLKIFDVIGQEVAQLVNGQLAAGQHNVNFDASSLNSGVYFYKIEANGVDGTSYSSVKKMILTK